MSVEIDRSKAPATSLPTRLELPAERVETSLAAVELHSLYAPSADVVRVSLVFGAGSRFQNLPYQAMSTLSMITEGTRTMSAAQIAEHLDFYGIYYDQSVDRDAATITVASASEFLPQALSVLEDLLCRPTFPPAEFDRYKAKKREQMLVENEKPSYIARRNFASALFGDDHPYGRFASPEAIDDLTREDLVRFYEQYIVAHPSSLFAVASGNVTAEVEGAILAFLERLPRAESKGAVAASVASEKCPQPTPRAAKRQIQRPEAVQSSIRLGRLMPMKSDPDYIVLQLLITVFGGYFSSRLMQNLREERGYTYGAYASMVSLEHAAYMAIATDVGAEHEADALRQIHIEMRRLMSETIGDEELAMAKNSIAGELMRLLDGPFGIADIAIENIQSSMPSDYINRFLSRINAITPDELQEAARKYFDPEALTQVVVGNS